MNSEEKNLLLKAERFCAYQERCGYEVEQKLKNLGADQKISSKIIASLRENNFLNEERFAKLFASGKFRIKRWGKNKIRAELRMKKVSDHLISNALDSINEEEYQKTIQHLIIKKGKETGNVEVKIKNQKIFRFLLSKGFESHLVLKILNFKS